ncbi:MAG: NADH-quinone oxidoreductase subunit N [Solirubrobacteraceae bacterium]|nr:NADH-quinone oxidoreductase subunit N [Solirubrobacteraceae bacterium]
MSASILAPLAALAKLETPDIDWAGLSPLLALSVGAVAVLLLGLFRARAVREVLVPALSFAVFVASIGLAIWQWDERGSLVGGALALDPLAMIGTIAVGASGAAAALLSIRSLAAREASHGEFHSLLLVTGAGMVLFLSAQNLVSSFLGLELLSIPLYVLAATELRRRRSLESGMKYLIIGSVGSATLLYGYALIFGATGHLDYEAIATAIREDGLSDDALLLGGIAMALVGLAFKASVAPFHQWTPDVYEGAPTSVTAFMATATKVAVLIAIVRLFDVALPGASGTWGPAVAVLAAIAMIVGNVGALGQGSVKRLLAYSSIAQAGYLLVGVVVATQLGAEAMVFYLLAYVVMSFACFAAVVAVEEETGTDDQQAFDGLGRRRPVVAVSLTLGLLGLAGVPATVGFVGKLRLVEAAFDNGYGWLALFLVIGSMISFAYYLRLVARMWLGGGQDAAVAATTADAAGDGEADRDGDADAALVGGGARAERDPDVATDGGDAVVVGGGRGPSTAVLVPGATDVATAIPDEVVPEPSSRPHVPAILVAAASAIAVVGLGVYPDPLMDTVGAVADALPDLF